MRQKAVTAILCATVFFMAQHFSALDVHAVQTNANNGDIDWKKENISKINEVRALIYAWATAWKSKDIKKYKSYYNPGFQTKDFDYEGWLKKKSKLFKKPGDISLEIFYLGVFVKNSHAYVSFIQRYKDAFHADIGEKNMVWIHFKGQWSIVSEEWKRLGSEGGIR